jgi:transcriptional regulator with XRE-family HTH domain
VTGRQDEIGWDAEQPERRHQAGRIAEAADISVDMVTKIETGASGARFPVIERIANALEVDPAELFTTDIPSGALKSGPFLEISTRLAGLSGTDLAWLAGIVAAALAPKGNEPLRSLSSKALVGNVRQRKRGSPR